MKTKMFALFKLFMLFIALVVTVILLLGERTKELAPDHAFVFVVDINRTMNTQDIIQGDHNISRLDAAKSIISQTIAAHPGSIYGLIVFNASFDYIIPPTRDTGTLLLYLSGVTTNLLPDGLKDFAQLSGMIAKNTSYLLLSDFDAAAQKRISLPRTTRLYGLGSLKGDMVRYANGVRYYDHGESVFSARNDTFARSLDMPYTSISLLDDFSPQHILFGGFHLPVSQRIFLYALLGVLIILTIML